MKKTILLIGTIAIVFNVLLGLLLTAYPAFNMGINCGVIVLNMLLLWGIYTINLRDAFRISFTFLFTFIGIVELILGYLMPQQLHDNAYLIATIILLFTEIALIIVTNILSNKIKR